MTGGALVYLAGCVLSAMAPDIDTMLLGRLFDTLGRRAMIAFTYGISGVLLALSGYLFSIGALSARSTPAVP